MQVAAAVLKTAAAEAAAGPPPMDLLVREVRLGPDKEVLAAPFLAANLLGGALADLLEEPLGRADTMAAVAEAVLLGLVAAHRSLVVVVAAALRMLAALALAAYQSLVVMAALLA